MISVGIVSVGETILWQLPEVVTGGRTITAVLIIGAGSSNAVVACGSRGVVIVVTLINDSSRLHDSPTNDA